MSRKKCALVLAALLVTLGETSGVLADQSEAAPTAPPYAVGVSFGWVVANGLSYRHYLGPSYVQATFAGTVDKEAKEEYVDFSLSYARYLNRFELGAGHFPIGVKAVGGLELEHKQGLFGNAPGVVTNKIHTGGGLGIDFGNPGARGIVFSLDLIYTATFKSFRKWEFVELGLLPSSSVHYNF